MELLEGGMSRGQVASELVSAVAQYENSNDPATAAAYAQFNNRVEVSDYTADNLQEAPADFQTSLNFAEGLTVTASAASVASAKAAVDDIVPVDTAELTELLGELQTANENLSDALEAYAVENDLTPATVDADAVANAANAAEAALGSYVSANATVLGNVSTDYNIDETGIDELGSQDAIENARLNVIQTQIAAEETRLDKALTTATKALTDADSGSSLKSLVDGYLRALTSVENAEASESAAAKDLNASLANFVSANAAQVDSAAVTTQYVPDSSSLEITVTLADGSTTATATYDESAKKWTVDPALSDLNLADVKANAQAQVSATDSVGSAVDLVELRVESLTKYDATQTNGTWDGTAYTAPTDTDGDSLLEPSEVFASGSVAEAYAAAQSAIVAFDKAREDFNKLVADVESARADAADIATLVEAVNDAQTALEEADYTVFNMVDTGVYSGTEGDDVALLGELDANGESATINDFGFAGNDVLFIGGDYTLNSGEFGTDGDDSTLEFFIDQVGANTVMQFEVNAFSSNPTVDQSFEVTLTGVNASDVSFQDGFITVA